MFVSKVFVVSWLLVAANVAAQERVPPNVEKVMISYRDSNVSMHHPYAMTETKVVATSTMPSGAVPGAGVMRVEFTLSKIPPNLQPEDIKVLIVLLKRPSEGRPMNMELQPDRMAYIMAEVSEIDPSVLKQHAYAPYALPRGSSVRVVLMIKGVGRTIDNLAVVN